MIVDGGANFHDFWDKHLFYVLFDITNYVHVDSGSTLSSAGVGLVPVILPGSLTLHSLATEYWTPTDHINTLSLSAIKLYSGFHRE